MSEAVAHSGVSHHPIGLVVTDDLRRWRLTVALRGVLVLPHLAVLAAWWTVASLVWIAMWVLTLIRGEAPPGLHGWLARLVRYDAHVCAYWFFMVRMRSSSSEVRWRALDASARCSP